MNDIFTRFTNLDDGGVLNRIFTRIFTRRNRAHRPATRRLRSSQKIIRNRQTLLSERRESAIVQHTARNVQVQRVLPDQSVAPAEDGAHQQHVRVAFRGATQTRVLPPRGRVRAPRSDEGEVDGELGDETLHGALDALALEDAEIHVQDVVHDPVSELNDFGAFLLRRIFGLVNEEDEVFADVREGNHRADDVQDHHAVFAAVEGEENFSGEGFARGGGNSLRIFLDIQVFVHDTRAGGDDVVEGGVASAR